jgi:hypothetical protein
MEGNVEGSAACEMLHSSGNILMVEILKTVMNIRAVPIEVNVNSSVCSLG